MAKIATTMRQIRMTPRTWAIIQNINKLFAMTTLDTFAALVQRGEALVTLWGFVGSGAFDKHPGVLKDAKALLERELQLRLDIAAFATTAAQRMAESPNE